MTICVRIYLGLWVLCIGCRPFEVEIVHVGDVAGQSSIIYCIGATRGKEKFAKISLQDTENNKYVELSGNLTLKLGTNGSGRFQYSCETKDSEYTLTMAIKALDCADDRVFVCGLYWTIDQDTTLLSENRSARLPVRVPPEKPVLVLMKPDSVASNCSGRNECYIYENDILVLKLSVVMGRPGKGYVKWKMWDGYGEEVPVIKDMIKEQADPQHGDKEKCKERIVSTLEYRIHHYDADVIVGAFAMNTEFGENDTWAHDPDQTCSNPVPFDACYRSPVYHTKSLLSNEDVTIKQSPPGVVKEGNNVTLTCSVSRPVPVKFMWIFQSPIGPVQMGLTSTETLTDLNEFNAGMYICTATTLNGHIHEAMASVNVEMELVELTLTTSGEVAAVGSTNGDAEDNLSLYFVGGGLLILMATAVLCLMLAAKRRTSPASPASEESPAPVKKDRESAQIDNTEDVDLVIGGDDVLEDTLIN